MKPLSSLAATLFRRFHDIAKTENETEIIAAIISAEAIAQVQRAKLKHALRNQPERLTRILLEVPINVYSVVMESVKGWRGDN